MSCICVVAVPVIISGWPILCGVAAAAAAKLGYEVACSDKRLTEDTTVKKSTKVDLELQNSELAGEQVAPKEGFVVRRGDITLNFTADLGGRFKVCVEGEGKSAVELRQIGQDFLNQMVQQYAYSKVMKELRSRGFNIVEEELDESHRIRIKARRLS
ncbi:MAG: DUF1257 domain-containing protein [Candidatus Coatesbacteria bacterium]|nr:DUF1257 domain-containing protein [Candidatus Coatesbacteria bacterium]